MATKKKTKEITVKELIADFDKRTSDDAKKKYIEAVVRPVEYMDFSMALVQAENIVTTSSYDENLNVKINSPKRFLLYAATLISDYTNIDIDPKNFMSEYDELCKRGVYKYILDIIPKDLIAQLDALVEMKLNDLITNEYEPRAYITKQLGKVYPFIGESLNKLIENINGILSNITNEDIATLIKGDIKQNE